MLSLRRYVIIFAFLTCIALAAWGIFILTVNPNEAGIGLFALFYADLAVAFIGIATLVGYGLRGLLRRRRTSHQRTAAFRTSFRQGALFALFFIGLLLMQASRLLTLGNGILLLIALTLVEFFFQSKEPIALQRMEEDVPAKRPDPIAAEPEEITVPLETFADQPTVASAPGPQSMMSTAWPEMSAVDDSTAAQEEPEDETTA